MTKLTLTALLTALLLATPTLAHSWIEQIAPINPNGTYYTPFGYPRGYIARTDPGYNDGKMTNLIPALSTNRNRIDATDLICPPSQRTTASQSAAYPRLKVAPGSALALRYLENGHVTLPQNQPGKPPMSGTTYLFGTTTPSDEEKLADVLSWSRSGNGSSGQGQLLAATNFDDGRCHQINSGSISQSRQQTYPNPVPGQPGTNVELWCETDVVLPLSLIPGTVYTAYWVWDWKTEPGQASGVPAGKAEYYTSCIDFDVVGAEDLADGDAPTSNFLVQQDGNLRAVSDWKSRSAVVSDPDVGFAMKSDWGSVAWVGGVPPTDAAAGSVSATQTQSVMVAAAATGEGVLPLTTLATSVVPVSGTTLVQKVTAGFAFPSMVVDVVTTTVYEMVIVTAAATN